MAFKQNLARTLEFVNRNHDVLAKVRNALIVYLVLIAVFRAVLWLGSRYASGESYAAFTLYSSFILIAVGGLGVAAYSYIGIRKNGNGFDGRMKKLKEEQAKMAEIRKKLKKQEKELKGVYSRRQKPQAEKGDGIITRLFAKSPDRNRLLSERRKLREERRALEEEKRSLEKEKEEMMKSMKKGNEGVIKKGVKRKKSVKGYSKLPASRHQRIEMFRKIARQIQDEKGSFTVAGVMEALVQGFPAEVDEDRKGFLREIEEWVSEDPYTPQLRVEGGVKLYRMITK
jgi:hypothetical protein